MERLALRVRDVFGARPWTVHDVLEKVETSKLPAQVQRSLAAEGTFPAKTLGQLLASSEFFIKRGTVHARKQLWLSVAQAYGPAIVDS